MLQLRADDPKAVSTIREDTRFFALLQTSKPEVILNFPIIVSLYRSEEGLRLWRAIVDTPEYSGDRWQVLEKEKASHELKNILERSNIHPDFLADSGGRSLLFGAGLKVESVRQLVLDPAVSLVAPNIDYALPPVGPFLNPTPPEDPRAQWPDLGEDERKVYSGVLSRSRELLEAARRENYGVIRDAVYSDGPLHTALSDLFNGPFERVMTTIRQHGDAGDLRTAAYFAQLKVDFARVFTAIQCEPGAAGTGVGMGDGLSSDARDGLAHYLANIKEGLHREDKRGVLSLSAELVARPEFIAARTELDTAFAAAAARLKELGAITYRLEVAGSRGGAVPRFPDLDGLLGG